MTFNLENLSWAVQRALHFNVITKMRHISYERKSENSYSLKVIVSKKLTDNEKDIIHTWMVKFQEILTRSLIPL